MATMKLTAIAIERELSYSNKSLFDGFAYPDDPDDLFNKEACNNRILMRCGEFEVLYSDPEFFRMCVNVWSAAYKRTFDKWLAAAMADYNPIENYNMRERFQDDAHNTEAGSGSDSRSMNNSASGTNNTRGNIINSQTSSANGTNTHTVSAFDSATYSPDNQDTKADSATANATETNTNDITTSTTGQSIESGIRTDSKEEKLHNIHTGERSGNIGVTSSQQLLESEFRVAMFSVYDRIADLFIQEFCIMVY